MFLVLLLDGAALVSILGARVGGWRRIRWIAAVVLLPPAGALLWLLRGRHRIAGTPAPRARTGGSWQT